MEPVRIKLYGLLTMTRRGYLMQLGIAGVLLLVLLILWATSPPFPETIPSGPANPSSPPPSSRPTANEGDLSSSVQLGMFLLNSIPFVVFAMVVLFGLEAVFVLRRFAREEALQRSRPKETPPPPAPPAPPAQP